jgi:hypothetical protein
MGGITAIISSVTAAIASFTDLHRWTGLVEVLMVNELARKARERLAEKIRPPPKHLGLPRCHSRLREVPACFVSA